MLFDDNAFFLLGASTRDKRPRLVELADEASLTLDPALCSRCCSDLITPRRRLQFEVAWLPGVAPAQALDIAKAALRGATTDPVPSRLAQGNALASSFVRDTSATPQDLCDRLVAIATAWEEVDAEHVRVLINDDRRAADVVLIDDLRDVERALHERMDALCNILASRLRALPLADRVHTLTRALERGTVGGTTPGALLLHAVLDTLSADVKAALEHEGERVAAAIALVGSAAASGQEAPIHAAITSLTSALQEWDRLAQPFQLSAMSRGHDHQPSRQMARDVRALAVAIHNDHSQTKAAKRISHLLRDVFAEVPQVVDLVKDDLTALDELIAQSETVAAQRAVLKDVTPLTSAPSMSTINGIGTKLYGRRDEDALTGTYIATLYFVVFFIPICPLSCYRVRDAAGGGWHFLGSVPFSQFEKVHAWGLAGAVGLWMLVSLLSSQSTSSYSYPTPSPPSSSARGVTAEQVLQLPPVSTQPETRSSGGGDYFSAAPAWIGSGRADLVRRESDLTALEARIQASKDEVERMEGKVKRYSLLATDGVLPSGVYEDYERDLGRYNRLVDEHNAMVVEYKSTWTEYERELAAFNDRIDRYNQNR